MRKYFTGRTAQVTDACSRRLCTHYPLLLLLLLLVLVLVLLLELPPKVALDNIYHQMRIQGRYRSRSV
jgi:hypothetical protein